MRLAYTQNLPSQYPQSYRLYLSMLGSFENRDYEFSRNRNNSNRNNSKRNYSGRKFYRRGGDLSTPVAGVNSQPKLQPRIAKM